MRSRDQKEGLVFSVLLPLIDHLLDSCSRRRGQGMSSDDYVFKYSRRRTFRDKIAQYPSEEAKSTDIPLVFCQCDWLIIVGPPGILDSSLKKHTTLLNRFRTSLLVGPAETLIKEIDGLSLTKYLEEIVAAVVEGATRSRGDPEVAVDVGTVNLVDDIS